MCGFENGMVFVFDKSREEESLTHQLPWVNIASIEYKPLIFDRGFMNLTKEKVNPVKWWNVCDKAITDLSLSPCKNFVAITCKSGRLIVADYNNQR